MRFPRHARVFRGQQEVYPFAGVLLLLLLLVLLHSTMVFTPGMPIRLPEAEGFPGLSNPTVVVAVDARGQCYYQNQLAREEDLEQGFRLAVERARGGPVTLVLTADEAVPNGLMVRLVSLARASGIRDTWLATQPPAVAKGR